MHTIISVKYVFQRRARTGKHNVESLHGLAAGQQDRKRWCMHVARPTIHYSCIEMLWPDCARAVELGRTSTSVTRRTAYRHDENFTTGGRLYTARRLSASSRLLLRSRAAEALRNFNCIKSASASTVTTARNSTGTPTFCCAMVC
jgi:hypothetical protein